MKRPPLKVFLTPSLRRSLRGPQVSIIGGLENCQQGCDVVVAPLRSTDPPTTITLPHYRVAVRGDHHEAMSVENALLFVVVRVVVAPWITVAE